MKHPGLVAALPVNLLALGSKLPALGGAQFSFDDLQRKGDTGGKDRVQSQASPCRGTAAEVKAQALKLVSYPGCTISQSDVLLLSLSFSFVTQG